MKSSQIRKEFLDFFKEQGHTSVQSSSLIPADDPTILFANAGMNQFKDVFLGKEKRSYVRAASSQKCVRAGGKHNDLDQVGFTERHLTFFEMLGNFSFGDYFKEDAISFAWKFLTEKLQLPAEKLYPTVHTSDDQAAELWLKVTGDPKKIVTRRGDKDNFWQMGDTGPCGPCTEIFYDRGEKYGPYHVDIGGENPRYIEIWNLVFMQFNRQADGTLLPLAQTGVDTGAGLERVAVVMQNCETVFDTDTFTYLRAEIEKLSGLSYSKSDSLIKAAFNVLCDHIRSSSFIIADGGMPSNEGRGYVLRKIIRRAALFAQKLGSPLFFPKLADTLIAEMGSHFPELTKSRDLIIQTLTLEVERFSENLVNGQAILRQYIQTNQKANLSQLSGEQVFKLYDTFGYPPELSTLMAQEYGFTVDMQGFEKEMNKQREQSGQKTDSATQQSTINVPSTITSIFTGYETTKTESVITWSQATNDGIFIVTEKSPFYVECGGQVDDTGSITINGKTHPVIGLLKAGGFTKNFAIVHKLPANSFTSSDLKVGTAVSLTVDAKKRADTANNHTATHLLQAALCTVLGSYIKQAGSVVHPDYLRFDFAHLTALTQDQIDQIENLVNQKITESISVKINFQTLAEAQQKGVTAFFGEKYDPEQVRSIEVPGFSHELCGGTHVANTGLIKTFKITSEASVATGVRRIVAVTGNGAEKLLRESFNSVKHLSMRLKTTPSDVCEGVERLFSNIQQLQDEIKALKSKLQDTQIPFWLDEMKTYNHLRTLYLNINDVDSNEIREICEKLAKRQDGLFVVTSNKPANPNIVSFVAYLSESVRSHLDLAKLSEFFKSEGLKGGGKAGILQGGGTLNDKAEFKEKLKKVFEALGEQMR
ncbi:alanine--tRNA ligase [Candidatus Dependentiae bacterium]|nr:alanine--tRNA ligase [Candidatus Dependentiae bacterium]